MCLQFTLQCVLKGNKPDFHCAMTADESRALYGSLLENMKKTYEPDKIKGKGIYILDYHLACLMCRLLQMECLERTCKFTYKTMALSPFPLSHLQVSRARSPMV